MTVGDDGRNFLRVGDIGEGISAEEDEVREFAWLDCTESICDTEKFGGIDRGGLQGFERGEARGNEALEFFMEAEARENVDSRRRVGSGEEGHTFFVEQVDDLEFFFEKLFSDS